MLSRWKAGWNAPPSRARTDQLVQSPGQAAPPGGSPPGRTSAPHGAHPARGRRPVAGRRQVSPRRSPPGRGEAFPGPAPNRRRRPWHVGHGCRWRSRTAARRHAGTLEPNGSWARKIHSPARGVWRPLPTVTAASSVHSIGCFAFDRHPRGGDTPPFYPPTVLTPHFTARNEAAGAVAAWREAKFLGADRLDSGSAVAQISMVDQRRCDRATAGHRRRPAGRVAWRGVATPRRAD